MLTSVSINNIVLIDQLHLDIESGFTSLTGETGAGKSILLDALTLALGGKADPDMIRVNADQACVVAAFSLKSISAEHPLQHLLTENAIPFEDELLLRRTLNRTQKGRSFVNDHVVTLPFLRQIGDYLLQIHGQHDHLLNESLHKTLLDDFAKAKFSAFLPAYKDTVDAYHSWVIADKNVKEFEQTLEKFHDQKIFYQEVLSDLESLNLFKGQEDELLEKRAGLQQLGKIISTVEQTLKSLETPTSWVTTLYGFQKNLERCDAGSVGPLKNAIQALERAGIEITEAQNELKSLFDADRTAAKDLETIDEHLHLIRSLSRKYKRTSDELCDLIEEAKNASSSQDDLDDQRRKLREECCKALDLYNKNQKTLFDLRKKAASLFESQVVSELPDLKLERAVFEVRVQQKENLAQDGGHYVSFWVSMNTGQEPAPLAKTASGGEMARLMLVLKMIIAQTTSLPTLIFDEIDTGVGGAVATAIGKKMHALGHNVQILSITHSAQVAACSDHHWRVHKAEKDGTTYTHVETLKLDARVDEIARMLSGATLTDEARRAAKRLIDG